VAEFWNPTGPFPGTAAWPRRRRDSRISPGGTGFRHHNCGRSTVSTSTRSCSGRAGSCGPALGTFPRRSGWHP